MDAVVIGAAGVSLTGSNAAACRIVSLRAESLTGLSPFQVPQMIRNANAVSATAPKPRLSIVVRPLSPVPTGVMPRSSGSISF